MSEEKQHHTSRGTKGRASHRNGLGINDSSRPSALEYELASEGPRHRRRQVKPGDGTDSPTHAAAVDAILARLKEKAHARA